MCGFDLLIRLSEHLKLPEELEGSECTCANLHERVSAAVDRRGPDFQQRVSFCIDDHELLLHASVLHIRGSIGVAQPVESRCGRYVLAWNGEYYGDSKDGELSKQSDTMMLLQMLIEHPNPPQALSDWEGPFALVLIDREQKCVWFGRDRLGRRSLLIGKPGNSKSILISSVQCVHAQEVPPSGFYRLSILDMEISSHPWEKALPFTEPNFWASATCSLSEVDGFARDLFEALRSVVQRQLATIDIGSVGVLFSGGIDSTVIAYLIGDVLQNILPNSSNFKKIDLINVSFTADSPDRSTALVSFADLEKKFPGRFRLICVDVVEEAEIGNLIAPADSVMDLNIGTALWFAGQGAGRVAGNFWDDNRWNQWKQNVLNAEGVVNAMNVSKGFNKPPNDHSVSDAICAACEKKKAKPDCLSLMCRGCCLRNGGCRVHRKEISMILEKEEIYDNPLDWEGCGEFFEISKSKILFVGHGADELLGGYGRHGKSSLALKIAEMKKDLERFWVRNLGRDDRCLSDWGREVRHPFWDERIISAVGRLPISIEGEISQEPKWLLREMVRRNFQGEFACADFRKRAIQFGTRIAQQTNIKLFGSHRKGKGTHKLANK